MSEITVFPQSCKGVEDCGICIFVCPKQVLVESDEINEVGYLPPKVTEVLSSFLCKIFLIQFLKEWQIVTHFPYRV